MDQKISYKDMLMKNPDKQFAPPKKVVVSEHSKRDIRKMCCSGDVEKLMKIPTKFFTTDLIGFLNKAMEEKKLEIEIWKCEDQNQMFDKQEELNLRYNGINNCIKYLETIKN